MRDRTYMGMRQQLNQFQPTPEPEPDWLITLVIFALAVGFFFWSVLGR